MDAVGLEAFDYKEVVEVPENDEGRLELPDVL
jgi:hypothetical protein